MTLSPVSSHEEPVALLGVQLVPPSVAVLRVGEHVLLLVEWTGGCVRGRGGRAG